MKDFGEGSDSPCGVVVEEDQKRPRSLRDEDIIIMEA